jgi:hypothetical protein
VSSKASLADTDAADTDAASVAATDITATDAATDAGDDDDASGWRERLARGDLVWAKYLSFPWWPAQARAATRDPTFGPFPTYRAARSTRCVVRRCGACTARASGQFASLARSTSGGWPPRSSSRSRRRRARRPPPRPRRSLPSPTRLLAPQPGWATLKLSKRSLREKFRLAVAQASAATPGECSGDDDGASDEERSESQSEGEGESESESEDGDSGSEGATQSADGAAAMEVEAAPREQALPEGTVVWAKLRGFPTWPCAVHELPTGEAPRAEKLWVRFFGATGAQVSRAT